MSISQEKKQVHKQDGDTQILQYIKQLGSSDIDTLNHAIQRLTDQGSKAIPELLKALVRVDEEIRKNAAWVLGMIKEPVAISPLLTSMTRDPSKHVRLNAAWALRHFKREDMFPHIFNKLPVPKTEEEVLFYLKSNSWKARWYCSVLLAETVLPSCLPVLLEMAREDEEVVVRCSSILTLRAYPTPETVVTLCDLLGDINDFVKIDAVSILTLMGMTVTVPYISRQVKAYNPDVRAAMLSALGALGNEWVLPDLIEALDDKVAIVRISAALSMVELLPRVKTKHPAVLRALLKALTDTDGYVVRNAACALGEVGYSEVAFKKIITLLKEEQRGEVVSNLAGALGSLGGKKAYRYLLKLLKHSNWEVRFQAVKSLGLLCDPRAFQPLVNMLQDPSLYVKEQAIWSLCLLKNKKALKVLEKMRTQYPYGRMQQAISQAMSQLLDL